MKWILTAIIPTTISVGGYMISIASTYLIDNEEIRILVDPGAQIISPTLLGRLNGLGISKEDISYVIVTHMHADHYKK